MQRALRSTGLFFTVLVLVLPSTAGAQGQQNGGNTCTLACPNFVECFDNNGTPDPFEEFVLLRSVGGRPFTNAVQGPRELISDETATPGGTPLVFRMCISNVEGTLRDCTDDIGITYHKTICPSGGGRGDGGSHPPACTRETCPQ